MIYKTIPSYCRYYPLKTFNRILIQEFVSIVLNNFQELFGIKNKIIKS